MSLATIDTPPSSAKENMKRDEELLRSIKPSSAPLLYFHTWQGKAATYGYFTRPERLFQKKAMDEKRFDLGKRPTGGGVIFHHTTLSFALFIPAGHPYYTTNTLENYACVNRHVIEAVSKHIGNEKEVGLLKQAPGEERSAAKNFCMAHPTKYDVFFAGKKVGGAAQRRTKNGLLHHGVISIALPEPSFLEEVLIEGGLINHKFLHTGQSLLPPNWAPSELKDAQEDLKRGLFISLRENL